MDAMTSLELEAQRRRETIAIDRGGAWARLQPSIEPVEVEIAPWAVRGSGHGWEAQGNRQPAALARNPVG